MSAHETASSPYGGQALIEGVMIRGPFGTTMAVRRPGGDIAIKSEPEAAAPAPYRRAPFLRGVFALYDTFKIGVRALYWSARVAAGQEEQALQRSEKVMSAVAILVAAVIFIAGPVLVTGWVGRVSNSDVLETLAEGVLRIAMLVGYIWFVGRLPEVQRVFQYHGAEHRAVHAYEHGMALTPTNLRTFPNAHPRCGTAFLLTVGVVTMVLFVALGTPPLWIRLLERVALTPVVAALAYEFLRASQAQQHSPIMRALAAPNLWLQRLTTRDPDDAQLEVAITALSEAIAFGELVTTPVSAAVVRVTANLDDDRS